MGMKATAAEYKSRLFSLVFPVAQTFYLLPLQHALWSWLIEQSGTKEKLLSTLAVTNPLVWSLGKLKKKKKAALLYLLIARQGAEVFAKK